jgi:hypothetical protein
MHPISINNPVLACTPDSRGGPRILSVKKILGVKKILTA